MIQEANLKPLQSLTCQHRRPDFAEVNQAIPRGFIVAHWRTLASHLLHELIEIHSAWQCHKPVSRDTRQDMMQLQAPQRILCHVVQIVSLRIG